jgi:hypothetical protein
MIELNLDGKTVLVEDKYLGDGVYASYDGYYIWLAADDHDNKVIALEPETYHALLKYVEFVNRQISMATEVTT